MNWVRCDTWLFHSQEHRVRNHFTACIPQLLSSGFSCEGSLKQAMKERVHRPDLPSSAHLEPPLAPGGIGDSKEAGPGLSAYLGTELQLRIPHMHRKWLAQCCHLGLELPIFISACVTATMPQTSLRTAEWFFCASHSSEQSSPVAPSHTKWCLSN